MLHHLTDYLFSDIWAINRLSLVNRLPRDRAAQYPGYIAQALSDPNANIEVNGQAYNEEKLKTLLCMASSRNVTGSWMRMDWWAVYGGNA